MESVIDYTEHCVEHSTDDQIMCMHTEIQSRAKITQLPIDAAKCMVTGEGLKSAEVNKPSQFEVLPLLSNGRPTKQACVVACTLKCLVDDTITQCKVELIEGNKYRIQYTPTIRGHHEQIVTVNGKEVAGSPFPVFVSIHPTLLGEPVGVLAMNQPLDVAVSTRSLGAVTQTSGNSTFFDKTGQKTTMNISKFGVSTVYGVAMDDTDDCVYISNGQNTIIKLCPDFKLVEKFTGQEGAKYRCMAVVEDEVMVTERTKNVVMVYTKDLKYVRQFGSYGVGPGQFKAILGVCSSETGNIFVSCFVRGCVHVFNHGGEFLHSFGQGEGVKLNGPIGVGVFGQYVHVAEYKGHCVSVFTTEGEYVTSFGKCGSGEGDFNAPRGICVDKDGFVYVCDYSNHRIQAF